MNEKRWPKRLLDLVLSERKRKGRPTKTWREMFDEHNIRRET